MLELFCQVSQRFLANLSEHDSSQTRKSLRLKDFNRIIFEYKFNRNKFDLPRAQIKGNIDILVISEIISDNSFHDGQLKIPGFATPVRNARNSYLWIHNGIHKRIFGVTSTLG